MAIDSKLKRIFSPDGNLMNGWQRMKGDNRNLEKMAHSIKGASAAAGVGHDKIYAAIRWTTARKKVRTANDNHGRRPPHLYR